MFIQRNETLTQKIVYLLVRLVCLGITNKQTNKMSSPAQNLCLLTKSENKINFIYW